MRPSGADDARDGGAGESCSRLVSFAGDAHKAGSLAGRSTVFVDAQLTSVFVQPLLFVQPMPFAVQLIPFAVQRWPCYAGQQFALEVRAAVVPFVADTFAGNGRASATEPGFPQGSGSGCIVLDRRILVCFAAC